MLFRSAEKCVFIGYPKETIGYTFYHRSEGKIFVAKNGSFLEEFLSKGVNSRKVELDEVIEPSLLRMASSAAPEVVPVPTPPVEEGTNDPDHETPEEETTAPRRSTREHTAPKLYGSPVLNFMVDGNRSEERRVGKECRL